MLRRGGARQPLNRCKFLTKATLNNAYVSVLVAARVGEGRRGVRRELEASKADLGGVGQNGP